MQRHEGPSCRAQLELDGTDRIHLHAKDAADGILCDLDAVGRADKNLAFGLLGFALGLLGLALGLLSFALGLLGLVL